MVDAVQGEFGKARGVAYTRVLGGGDSAGGNMTAALSLRRRDSSLPPLAGQIMLYPEARVPFDTPACVENNTGPSRARPPLARPTRRPRPARHSPADPLAPRDQLRAGLYLEANGIFSFADHYAVRGTPPSHPYISPGMQPIKDLANQPPAAIFTSGFDPLRDVGVEYAHKLDEAGVRVSWDHYPDLTHGWLQMTAWSDDAAKAVTDVAERMKGIVYAA